MSDEEEDIMDYIVRKRHEENRPPTIDDPRVVEAAGGGIAPEQHYGTLTNGDRFYLRTRHGYAQLHVASAELCEKHGESSWIAASHTKYPPLSNPEYDFDAAVAARNAGVEYMPFWIDRVAEEELPDGDYGAYDSRENRNASFKRLLDQLWTDPRPDAKVVP
jgi:hypothetical protein